jgi:hypothetical protein
LDMVHAGGRYVVSKPLCEDLLPNTHECHRRHMAPGAAGAVGRIGRNLTEMLLAKRHKVRAFVRREDERADALRQLGAEVMQGDLADLTAMHRAIEGLRACLFRQVGFGRLPDGHSQNRRSCAPPWRTCLR